MRLATPIVLATVLALVPSCVETSPEVGEATSASTIDNRIALNRIALNRIALNRIALNRLNANLSAIGDLLDTPDGQELFSFIVSCALPEGVTLVAPDPTNGGAPIEFFGELGLAPRWEHRPLNMKDKGWVSACMLARVNNNNVTVSVSLRGSNPGLTTDPAEVAAYSLQEGAFYGNIFVPVDQPLRAYSCRGRDQALLGEVGALADRDCAEPDPAHPGLSMCSDLANNAIMNWAGDCADFVAPKNTYACKRFTADGHYVNCSTTAAFGGSKKSGHHEDCDDEDDDDDDGDGHGTQGGVFRQVITTFVKP